MVRQSLDRLYLWSAYLAGLFLMLIALTVMIQVISRMFGLAYDFTKLSGFYLAATSFLALPHTLKHGAHVRVTLLMERLTKTKRLVAEFTCCLAGAIVVGYAAYYVVLLDITSYRFHDVTSGLLALPFWLPQLAMAIGLTLLEVAIIDELLSIALGKQPSYDSNKDSVL